MKKMPGFKHELRTYLDQECIATLAVTVDDQLNFFYHETWQQLGYAISPHLPLDNSAAASQLAIKTFFQNLFPEGENFDILLESFRLSKNNTFAITQNLGLDLPGALQIISPTAQPPSHSSFRKIQSHEIVERLQHYNARNLVIWDGKPRLSVAGVHQKINVILNQNEELGFGEGKLCSTHILKFDRTPEKHIVINEFLMMTLAKMVGLTVAETELKYFDQYPTLLIKRFDRKKIHDSVKRRHVIDGCQALNLLPEYKYERHLGSGRDVQHIREGANLHDLFSFCNSCRNPALSKKQLLDWTLFNLIIGNLDAHGKNISFFISQFGIEIAPFYDLICVRLYPEFTQELAMAIGDEFEATAINAYQLADFSDSCKISRSIVSKRLLHLCEQTSNALGVLSMCVNNFDEKAFARQLTEDILKQISHFKKQARLITSIKV